LRWWKLLVNLAQMLFVKTSHDITLSQNGHT